MKIKQVEELVGITRKNIRFYEEQGLLNVERAERLTMIWAKYASLHMFWKQENMQSILVQT